MVTGHAFQCPVSGAHPVCRDARGTLPSWGCVPWQPQQLPLCSLPFRSRGQSLTSPTLFLSTWGCPRAKQKRQLKLLCQGCCVPYKRQGGSGSGHTRARWPQVRASPSHWHLPAHPVPASPGCSTRAWACASERGSGWGILAWDLLGQECVALPSEQYKGHTRAHLCAHVA